MKSRFFQRSILGLALAAGILTGCKKDDPATPNPPHGCYLSIETASSNLTLLYKWDASGRLVSETEISAFDSVVYREIKYTYNSSGHMIKKATFQSSEETEREEFIYEGDRKTRSTYSADTTGDGTISPVFNYIHTYDANGRISNTKSYNGTSTTQLTEDENYQYDSRGNLIKVEWTRWTRQGAKQQGTTEYTYDDKPHPHSAFRFPAMLNWETTVNNILTETRKDENGDIKHAWSYTYEYDSNGMPVHRSITSGSFHYEYHYTYNCL